MNLGKSIKGERVEILDLRINLDIFDRKNVEKEFNFQNEARNAEGTMERFEHRKDVFHVPKVHWNLTRDRILTMEYIEGVKVNNVEALQKLGVDPKWVGRLVQEIFAEM